MLKSIFAGITDIVFPRNCILCRQYHPATAHDPLCPGCRQTLPLNKPPFCLRCSRHLDTLSEEGLCPACRAHPPAFDEAWALLLYTGAARDILHRFKFHNKTSLQRTFNTLLKQFITRYGLSFPQGTNVIPLPPDPIRLRERGYDQALLLARAVAHELDLPIAQGWLNRTRPTHRQSELGAKDRWTNIDGAFKMENSAELNGRTVILVDDIMTTSATASEASRTLKDAGASRVIVITLAIAPCGSFATTS